MKIKPIEGTIVTGAAKFQFLHSMKEMKPLTKFTYKDDATIRVTCAVCHRIQAPNLNVTLKYREFDCLFCGHKTPVNTVIPDASDVRGKDCWLGIFFKN